MNKLFDNFTIRFKILISMLVVGFLVTSALVTFNYLFSVNFFTKISRNHLQSTSVLKGKSIEIFVDGMKNKMIGLASDSKIKDCLFEIDNSVISSCTKQELTKYLIDDKLPAIEDLILVSIVDVNGLEISSSSSVYSSDIFSSLEYISRKEKPFFGKIHKVDNFGLGGFSGFVVDVSAPVVRNGELVGVITGFINADSLFSILTKENIFSETEDAYLVNIDGTMVSPSRLVKSTALNQVVDTDIFKECKKSFQNSENPIESKSLGQIDEFYADYRGIEVMGFHSFIEEPSWCLITEIDKTEVFAPIKKEIIISFEIIVILLFIIVFSSAILSNSISSPIKKLELNVKKIINGDFDHKVGGVAGDELGSLSRIFDQMTSAIKQSRLEIHEKVEIQIKEIKKRSEFLSKAQDDLQDQRLAILNILEDVDEERNISVRAAKDLDKFRLAVENVTDQIVITDPEGIVIYANQAMEKITGYNRTEALGKKAGRLWGNLMDKKYFENMWKVIKIDKKNFIGEIKNKRKNGKEYIADIHISPILDENNRVIFFVAIERDISKAKEVDKMKSEFLGVAAHQLRTPLGSIRWNLELLLSEDVGKIGEEAKQVLLQIAESNKNLLLIVNDLLNVSRIDQGRVSDRPELLQPVEILKDVANDLMSLAKERNIKINFDDLCEDSPQISLDKTRLRDVFSNLISNAIKYNKENGKVDLSCRKLDNAIEIKIADTGVGIPEDDQKKIFSKFFRATNAIKSETEGSGMGLFVVRSYLRAWGGDIKIKSMEGKGTTVTITIPLKPKSHTLTKNLNASSSDQADSSNLTIETDEVVENKDLLTKDIGTGKIEKSKTVSKISIDQDKKSKLKINKSSSPKTLSNRGKKKK